MRLGRHAGEAAIAAAAVSAAGGADVRRRLGDDGGAPGRLPRQVVFLVSTGNNLATMPLLARVGLEPYAEHPVDALSGGQQRRVALAPALVMKPRVILFDEPMSNLDAKLRHHVRAEIRALQQRPGLTTVHVSLDQEEALAISDRVVVMNAGRIEQQDSFCDIGRAPAALAADFPVLRFDHLDDPWWHEDPADDGPFARETLDALQRRVSAFRDWLSDRPERTLAVVGHGTFLRLLTDVPFANAQRVVVRF